MRVFWHIQVLYITKPLNALPCMCCKSSTCHISLNFSVLFRLSDNVKWYIDEATKILETNGEFAPQGTANKLIQVIKSGM